MILEHIFLPELLGRHVEFFWATKPGGQQAYCEQYAFKQIKQNTL